MPAWGTARASTARQSLDSQLDSLAEAGVTRIFSEKISTRATQRPELDEAAARRRISRSSSHSFSALRSRPISARSRASSSSRFSAVWSPRP
ncbi:recombinase family protein [Streptomyces gelaticus]|uniref:recombinase family protein n=1 Tax=Streptomyces gelaticus TaxID=285446 RepID=UPI0037978A2A